jgi:hypothetical protein
MSGRKAASLAIAVFALALVLGAGGWMALHSGASIRNEIAVLTWPHAFTTADWRSHPSQRWAMARDLVESTKLRGMSVADVGQLLGKSIDNEAALVDIPAPSPGWPHDDLRVWFDGGKVSGWSLNSDPLMGPAFK